MTGFKDTLSIAASGMQAQSARLRLVSENIANADTPGYRRKVAAFSTEIAGGDASAGRISLGPVALDQAPGERRFDPGNPMADADGYVSGSNVDLVIEVADAREAQRSYEANLRLFDQTRRMASSWLELLRR